MPVRCKVDNKIFNNLAEVGNHISETYEGIQGEWQGFGPEKPTTDDIKRTSDVLRGFSHISYINDRGETLPEVGLHPKLMAGHKWCTSCRARFTNNYALYAHMIENNHGSGMLLEHAKDEMKELKEFERKWF